MKAPNQPGNWRPFLSALMLLLLVGAAYYPALRGDFLWDDDANIIKNVPLRSLDGLRRIWFEPGATQQFYPVTHTSFWLDYHLWRLHPAGYHAENILLHALSAILVWRILLRLKVPGAWLAAALFALHPVCVESVAWITERKNTMSCVFFLGAVMMAVRFWLPDEKPAGSGDKPPAAIAPWKFYWLTLAFYLCALLSKTAIVGLPGVIVLLLWWKRRGPSLRDAVLLLPFLVLGLAGSLITIHIEKNNLGAGGEAWAFSLVERCLIAGKAFCFYIGKLAWPHPLMFMYPRWEITQTEWLAYVPAAAVLAFLGILWWRRNSWGRPALMAIGFFVVLLFPVLGFFNVLFFYYSFVCDHFQYVAMIGPLALLAAGVTTILQRWEKAKPWLKPAICALALLALGALSWQQTRVYTSLDALWRDTLDHNPRSWMAHDNMGRILSNQGKFADAAAHYQTALELHPTDYVAWNNLGLDAFRQNDPDEAIGDFTRSLSIYPDYAYGHYNLGNALAVRTNLDDAISHYQRALELDPDLVAARLTLANALFQRGEPDKAITHYRKVLDQDPELASAHALLGRALAARGKPEDAVVEYKRALDLDPNSVDALANLGNALIAQGSYDEAINNYRRAIVIKPNDVLLHRNLAVALLRLGRRDEARNELAIVLRLNPNDNAAAQKLQMLDAAGNTGK
jgi:tetratricopeptide (TPR) repeat protein